MRLPPKTCPQCHAEYHHTAETCSDCHCSLVFPEQPDTVTLPPAAELAPLVRGGPWELQRIAGALGSAGIHSRIDSYPPGAGIKGPAFRYAGHAGHASDVCLYVAEEDFEGAQAALEAYRASSLPGGHAPAEVGEELTACPACSTPFRAGAESCSDCGLVFQAESMYCVECGADLTPEDPSCPGCGISMSDDGGV